MWFKSNYASILNSKEFEKAFYKYAYQSYFECIFKISMVLKHIESFFLEWQIKL